MTSPESNPYIGADDPAEAPRLDAQAAGALDELRAALTLHPIPPMRACWSSVVAVASSPAHFSQRCPMLPSSPPTATSASSPTRAPPSPITSPRDVCASSAPTPPACPIRHAPSTSSSAAAYSCTNPTRSSSSPKCSASPRSAGSPSPPSQTGAPVPCTRTARRFRAAQARPSCPCARLPRPAARPQALRPLPRLRPRRGQRARNRLRRDRPRPSHPHRRR